MSDFQRGVLRTLKKHEQAANQPIPAHGPTLGELYGMFLGLPALRGAWFGGVIDNAGAIYDQSGQGRTLTVGAGSPSVNIYNSLVPYMDYGGASYHSRADEAGLDVLGTETNVNSAIRGLTFGGWFWFNSLGTIMGMLSKWTGVQQAYTLYKDAANTIQLNVSNTGADSFGIGSVAVTATSWCFCVGRFVPSTTVDLYVNGVKTSNAVAIPAALFNGTAALEIGRVSSANNITGRCALAFLCAATLSDNLLTYLFNRSRWAFGV